MKITTFALAATLALTAVAVHAQESNRTINQRKVDQQERAINHEERSMRAQDNGHLTCSDRSVLQHQQNTESRRIYRDKHNDRVR
jgi:hypothetical protein